MELISHSEQETAQIAADYAQNCPPGTALALSGDLGAGKSVFCRALIRTLTGDPTLDVPSPTFTLVQIYDTPAGPLYHFDLYRLDDPEEIWELGWEEALTDGITLIEWPEKAGPYLPENHRAVSILTTGPETRKITMDE